MIFNIPDVNCMAERKSILFLTKVATPNTEENICINMEAKTKENKILTAATILRGTSIILSIKMIIADMGKSRNIPIMIFENNTEDTK